MAVTLEQAVTEARAYIGSVRRTVTDWGDRWVFYTANKYQYGGSSIIIDKETGKNQGGLLLDSDENNPPENPTKFELPEGLYDELWGDELLPKNWIPSQPEVDPYGCA